MAGREIADRSMDPLVSVVVSSPREVERLSALLARLEGALAGMPHEFLVICDAETLRAVEAMPARPAGVRLVENAGRERSAAAYAQAFHASAGDVVVTLNEGEGDDVSLIPSMVQKVRAGGCAVVSCGPRWRGPMEWVLFVLAGMDVGDVSSRFRAYAAGFLEEQRIESSDAASVRIELVVKANLQEQPIASLRTTSRQIHAFEAEPPARWIMPVLQAPIAVWTIWLAMIVVAVAGVEFRHGGAAMGDLANIALLASAAFAFTIAARRVRYRMRIADAFFSLVLLNPLLMSRHAVPFDRTLMATGVLGLMAGAIIAMERNNPLRYVAVMVLALLLTWLSKDFVILLPALAAWLIAAGYGMGIAPAPRARARGFVVLAVGEIGLFAFGLACVLGEATPSPMPERLFSQIVGMIDFPLIVLAIVMVGLGWTRGRGGKTPPHFSGVLALLVGLLALLLNNFQTQELGTPGADQTVLLICLLYTVFALHGPQRLRWVVPPALLIAAAAYTVFR